MSYVEVERNDGIMVIRLNRPDRMNALGTEMRNLLKRRSGITPITTARSKNR